MQGQINSQSRNVELNLTQEQVSAVARTLRHYIAAAEENGWLLPSKNSNILSR